MTKPAEHGKFPPLPTELAYDSVHLPYDLGVRGTEARNRLAARSLIVTTGMTRDNAIQILDMAYDPTIKRRYTSDLRHRFPNIDNAIAWQRNGGKGRAMFTLRKYFGSPFNLLESDIQSISPRHQTRLAGYGWVGDAPDQARVTQLPHSLAMRVGDFYSGGDIELYFATAILAGAAVLYGVTDIGLECWKSAEEDVEMYKRAGFTFLNDAEQPARRSSDDNDLGFVDDVRCFARFDSSILEQPLPPEGLEHLE